MPHSKYTLLLILRSPLVLSHFAAIDMVDTISPGERKCLYLYMM